VKLRAALGLSTALLGVPAVIVMAQPPAGVPGEAVVKTPLELFRQAQNDIRDGRFDVAAENLKKFAAANPSDQDLLELARNEPTVFVKLRNVPVWSDNQQAQADAMKAVEEIIAKAEVANKKLNQDPATVAKFVRNLGATLEERIYAEGRLRLAGDAAAPAIVDALRTSSDANLRAGIAGMITKLNIEQLPGILGAVDGLPGEQKLIVLRSLASRPDIAAMLASGDTDFTPHLWYFASSKTEDLQTIRSYSSATLEALTGGLSTRRSASEELVKLAAPFVAKKGRFRTGDRVKLWSWDEANQTVTPTDLTAVQAGDYLGVRNLRWAIERNPNDVSAQEQFLSLTVERSVEAGQFGELAQTDPALYQVLAAAPFNMLSGLLERALADNKTSLAFGLTAALAKRGDRPAAEVGGNGRPGVLLKALDYPDVRVQLAAAAGIINAGTTNHGRHAKIVDILRRVAASDTLVQAGKEVGKALIVDPLDLRGDRLAAGLRNLGYTVERFATGRELATRLNRAADADLVFVDRHVVNPTLPDLFPMLGNTIDGKPVFIVASVDQIRPVSLEQQLLRLAALIAITETSSITIPPPFAFDPRIPIADGDRAKVEAAKVQLAASRDRRMDDLFRLRLARLQRLVAGAGLPISATLQTRLDQRLPQLTYIALAAEHPVTLESSPLTFKSLEIKSRIVANTPQFDESVDKQPATGLTRLIEELDGALDAPHRKLLDDMLSRIDPVALGIAADAPRDLIVEQDLQRFVRGRKLTAAVIPETVNPATLAEDLKAAGLTPAQAPVNIANKKKAARRAVELFRKLALGEVLGYDIRPAEAALRNAMKDDDLAEPAIDAVGRIPGAEAQQDLLAVAMTVGRKPELRLRAGDRLIQHIQTYGKLIPANQLTALTQAAATEADTEVRGRLAVIRQLLAGSSNDVGDLIRKYPLPLPKTAEAPPMPMEKKEPEKKDPGM